MFQKFEYTRFFVFCINFTKSLKAIFQKIINIIFGYGQKIGQFQKHMSSEIPSSLVSQILCSGSSLKVIPDHISQDIDEIFESVTIQIFSMSEIKQIEISLDEGTKSIFEILSQHSFNFPFLTDLLKKAVFVDSSNKDIFDFLTVSILYSFIAWCNLLTFQKSVPPIKELLAAFVYASNSSYSDIIKTAFNTAIKLYIENTNDADIYAIYNEFVSFIYNVSDPPITLFYFEQYWKKKIFANQKQNSSLNLDINENFLKFIDRLANVLETKENYFDEQQKELILNNMSLFILQMKPPALKLLVALAKPISKKSGTFFFSNFGKALEQIILTADQIQIPKIDQNVLSFTNFEGSNLPLDFPSFDSFPNGFNPNLNVTFPDTIPIPDILSCSLLKNIMELLAKLIANNPDFFETFVESFSESLQAHYETVYYGSVYGTLLYICYKAYHLLGLKSSFLHTKLCVRFYNEKFFSPDITVFNCSDLNLYKIINSFRSPALELILADNGTAFETILIDAFCPYPLILAEIFQRLTDNFLLQTFIEKISKFPKLIDTIIQISINYQEFERNSSSQDADFVRKARMSIFGLLGRVLYNPKICLLAFSRQLFVLNFLSFAFEKKLSSYILGIYKNFLISSPPEIIEESTQIIFSIITVLISKLTNRKSKEILLIIIKSINESMINHPQINHLFSVFCNALFMSLSSLCQNITRKNSINIIDNDPILLNKMQHRITYKRRRKRIAKSISIDNFSSSLAEFTNQNDILTVNQQLLKEIIQFFALTASFYSISEEQIDLLINALLSFKNSDYILESYNLFIQLLAGDCLNSLNPCFIIRQPQVLKLFIRVLIDSPKLIEILTFIYELCKFSQQNIKTCAISELDLFLLDILDRDKIERKFSKETVELILNLFALLSTRHSSSRAVYNYINLIAGMTRSSMKDEISNKFYVYQHEQLLLNTLDIIINNSLNEPASTFALVSNKVISVEIPAKQISNGFTFVCWLNIEEKLKDYEPDIFTIKYFNDIMFKFSIQHSALIITQDDGISEATGKIGEISDINTWHFLSLMITIEDGSAEAIITIDGQSTNKLTMISEEGIFPNGDKNAILTLGGLSCENPIDAQFPSRIACCGIFPILSNDQKLEVFEMGKRIISTTFPVPPIKFFYGFKEETYLETNGFLNILTEQCGICPLLPLFTLRDTIVSFNDENQKSNSKSLIVSSHSHEYKVFEIRLDYIIQLLTKILISSFECQKKFYQENGFLIIRNLLINHWMDKFTFKIYSSFIYLFQHITNENLQGSLFIEILANFGLLIKIDDQQVQLRILKYWQQSLLDSCRAMAVKSGLIKQILPAITQLFTSNDSKNHRQYLFRTLRNSVEASGFDISFIEHVIGHVLICNQIDIQFEITQFLIRLITDSKDMFKFNLERDLLIFFVSFLIKGESESIQIQGIEMLIASYTSGLISPLYASKIIHVIIETTKSYLLSNNLFNFISEKLSVAPFLLSAYFYIAYKMKLKVNNLSQYQSNEISFNIGNYWALWGVIYCVFNTEEQDQVLKFLISISNANFCSLFSQLLFVCHNCQLNTVDHLIEKFISILQVFLITNPFNISDLFEISEYITMFRLKAANVSKSLSRNDISTNMNNFSQKEMHIDNHLASISQNKMVHTSSSDVILSSGPLSEIENAIKIPTFIPLLDFEMKINQNKHWKHQNLSMQILQIFANKGLIQKEERSKYLFFILTLSAFLKSQNLNWNILEYIKSLSLSENEYIDNKVALNLINYKLVCSGKTAIDMFGKISTPFINDQAYSLFIEKNKPSKLEKSIRETFKDAYSFIQNLKEKCFSRTRNDDSEFSKDSLKLAKDFKSNLLFLDKCGQSLWNKLWTVISFENAPWSITDIDQNNKSNSNVKFERNSILNPVLPTRMTIVGANLPPITLEGKILLQEKCILLTVLKKTSVIFTVFSQGISIKWGNHSFRIKLQWIDEIITRASGFEIYTLFGITFCIECDQGITDKFFDVISSINKDLNSNSTNIHTIKFITGNLLNNQGKYYTTLWINSQISNFDYIMKLNRLFGHSFHDLNCYPLMPYIYQYNQTGEFINQRKNFNKVFRMPAKDDVLFFLQKVEPFKNMFLSSLKKNEQEIEENQQSNPILQFLEKGNIDTELIPEFFAFEKLIDQNFVYHHRKMLESSEISSNLHLWLSKIFFNGKPHPHKKFQFLDSDIDDNISFSTNTKGFYNAYFISPLKVQFFLDNGNTLNDFIFTLTESKSNLQNSDSKNLNALLTSRKASNNENHLLSTKNIKSDLSLSSHIKGFLNEISEDNSRRANVSNKVSVKRIKKVLQQQFNHINQVIYTSNSWIILSQGIVYIIIIDETQISGHPLIPNPLPVQKYRPGSSYGSSVLPASESYNISELKNVLNYPNVTHTHLPSVRNKCLKLNTKINVEHMAAEGKWIIVSHKNSSIIEIFFDMDYMNSVETYENNINFLRFNERKKLLICAIRDKVILIDVVCASIINVIYLKNVKNAVITNEWGFSLLFIETNKKRKFNVVTENGELLHELFIDDNITFMKSLTSISGEDYIVYSTENGIIYIIKPSNIEIIGPIFNTNFDKVMDATYDQPSKILSLVAASGTVSFIPLTL